MDWNTNWSRARLKEMARTALHGSYWKCVLVSLILSIAVGSLESAAGSSGGRVQFSHFDGSAFFSETFPFAFPVLAFFGFFFATYMLLGLALQIFLFGPLEVGCKDYYRQDIFHPAELASLGTGFSREYLNIVKTQFFRWLYTLLWGLLFIIPGIVKSYEYRMMPYIQAEHPEMPTQEVFDLSRRMMYGEKWNTFVLDLSFLGWHILSVFTFGLLEVFYVRPYMDLTNAALYGALKQKLEMQQDAWNRY